MPPISTTHPTGHVPARRLAPNEALNADDLAAQARLAYRQACEHLMRSTLPSIWSTSGCGWQEHWTDATAAGFYASCDGIISLVKRPPSVPDAPPPLPLLRKVYLDHLCRILDPQVLTNTDQQRLVRQTCLNTSIKLAKFLQASACLPLELTDTVQHLISPALRDLSTLGRSLDGRWPASLTEPHTPSLAATCEALLALHSYLPPSDPLLAKARDSLLASLEEEATPGRMLVILWTLSHLPPISTDHPASLSTKTHLALSLLAEHDDTLVPEFFPSTSGQGDYYHFNASLLGTLAAVRLLEGQLTDWTSLQYILPVAARAIARIRDFGFYQPTSHSARPRFWENHQALCLLAGFCALLDKEPTYGDRVFMHVSPRHFRTKRFTPDPSLAVVLMPLTPEWSNDVFAALSDPLERRGFHAWRSDLRFSDDEIMQTIWEKINEAALVIADCTSRNPNVFYELGIAHTIGKPVFLCAQRRQDIPFDLAHIRSFEYGGAIPTQLKKLAERLDSFLDDLASKRGQ